MDIGVFNNLAGALYYHFSDLMLANEPLQQHPFVVRQIGDQIDIVYWDEVRLEMPQPDEAILLTWIQEFEALTDYERLSSVDQARVDVVQGLLDKPLVQALLMATPAQIDAQVDAADMAQLRNVIKILILAVRMLFRQSGLLEGGRQAK